MLRLCWHGGIQELIMVYTPHCLKQLVIWQASRSAADWFIGILPHMSAHLGLMLLNAQRKQYGVQAMVPSFLQIAVPSRTDVPEYQKLRSMVHEIVGRINGAFGTLTYVPIHHLDRQLSFHELCALYAVTGRRLWLGVELDGCGH